MTFLADTHVLGELARPRPNRGVVIWASQVAGLNLSVVSLEEIYYGLSWKPNDRISSWIEKFLTEQCRILPITDEIARRAGEIRGRFRDEATALKSAAGIPPFHAARELIRVVQSDCCVEIDTNAYSVPWRLISESVRVLVTVGPNASTPSSFLSNAVSAASAESSVRVWVASTSMIAPAASVNWRAVLNVPMAGTSIPGPLPAPTPVNPGAFPVHHRRVTRRRTNRLPLIPAGLLTRTVWISSSVRIVSTVLPVRLQTPASVSLNSRMNVTSASAALRRV